MAYTFKVSGIYGTHLACLIKAMEKTTGDVLELGTGLFSTPYLHYQCIVSNRKLYSYENYMRWIKFFTEYEYPCDNHKLIYVEKYADAPIDKEWDVVLIDQTPDSSRAEEIIRLKDKAKYIVIHDSNPENYEVTHYDEVFPLFKYRIDWKEDYNYKTNSTIKIKDTKNNQTSVLSNLVNLEDFWL